MPSSQSEWDAKHRLAAEEPAPEPASIVRELLPLLPTGPALDVACGAGRHALLLADRGQQVTGIDWSGAALDVLAERARSQNIPVLRIERLEKPGPARHRGITLLQANLEQGGLPEQGWDLILCIQYLQRSLFPHISRALRPEGLLLMETYTRAQLEFAGGPRNPAHLLAAGELRHAFPELCVLFYRELRAGQGIASLLARKPN